MMTCYRPNSILFFFFFAIIFIQGCHSSDSENPSGNSSGKATDPAGTALQDSTEILAASMPEPKIKVPEFDVFGFDPDVFHSESRPLRRNENLSHLLGRQGFTNARIHAIAQAARQVFNPRRMVAGRPVHFYFTRDSLDQPSYLVYERDAIRYIVFQLEPPYHVFAGEQEVQTKQRLVEGIINRSLYESFVEQNADPRLAYSLANVFAWQIDFYRIQPGDAFRILYEEKLISGESVGLGRIKAAEFTHRNRAFEAVYFEQNGRGGYFDRDGNSLRKAFLRAPLEYSRISSRFTNNRRHPILNRNMPHHGTDYAAPTGTPIRAVGDGQIVHAGYDRNNGNYIRIRHNSTHETGYLHMSRMAPGMRNGARVTQGQVIGYVGSTGLATGPHLCYRFWKNGRPVDPYRIEFPSSEPIEQKYAGQYTEHMAVMLAQLDPETEPEILEEEAEPVEDSPFRLNLATINLQPKVILP